MIEGYLQVPGVPGNSTEPGHAGWLELIKLDVKPVQIRRTVPSASLAPPPSPIRVYGWSILGPHSRGMRAMWALGKEFEWGVLEVVKSVKGKPLLQHRIRMTAIQVTAYQPIRDPGLAKPVLHFELLPTAYTSQVGSTLRLTLLHEQTHAAERPPGGAGGPLQRPVPNTRTPPTGHP